MVSAAASRAFNQALAQHRAAALCAMRFRTSLGQRCTGENKASMGSRTLQCLSAGSVQQHQLCSHPSKHPGTATWVQRQLAGWVIK